MNLRPTNQRRMGLDHLPPAPGPGGYPVDNAGGLWLGTSRIIDRAARRKNNKRTWAALKASSRRAYVRTLQPPLLTEEDLSVVSKINAGPTQGTETDGSLAA